MSETDGIVSSVNIKI